MKTTDAEVKARGSVYGHAADRTIQWNSTSERVPRCAPLCESATRCNYVLHWGFFTSCLDEAVSYLDKAQNSRSAATPAATTMQTATGATSTSRSGLTEHFSLLLSISSGFYGKHVFATIWSFRAIVKQTCSFMLQSLFPPASMRLVSAAMQVPVTILQLACILEQGLSTQLEHAVFLTHCALRNPYTI